MMTAGGELMVERWEAMKASELLTRIDPGLEGSRPLLVAVDGRSGAGKTTVADRLAAAGGGDVVHTDDVAWNHSFFDWDALLTEGILRRLRGGESVDYRPPGWDSHDRPGSIRVSGAAPLVVIEGVGVGRASLRPWFDAVIWVQIDRRLAKDRAILRDGGDEKAISFWEEWDAAEVPFLDREAPWSRAAAFVNGNPRFASPDELEVAVAPGLTEQR